MSDTQTIDVSDMLAVHGALRSEIEGLSTLVAHVEPGDAERAAIVGEHYALITRLLSAHHHGEDLLLWPVLSERQPAAADLVARMQRDHAGLEQVLAETDPAAQRWSTSGDPAAGALLAAGLAELSAEVDAHFAVEEAGVLPVAARTLTEQEWAAIGEHSRGDLAAQSPQLLMRALGTILDHCSPEAAASITAAMPPPALAAWTSVGEPDYRAYQARVQGTG